MQVSRSTQIIRTSVIGIVANVLLAVFKAFVGVMANSVAVIMDAVNNLSDALSSIITIAGVKLSQRPADYKHPFGYGRVEYFTAIVISVIVLMAGLTSFVESVKKIINPTTPDYTTVTLIVIVVAIVVKLLLGVYVKRQGNRLNSDALVASGADALFDAVVTLATLVSAGIMLLWSVSIDGVLGALIAILIIKAGIEMLAGPVNELLGARISKEFSSQIKHEVADFAGVRGVYDLILHNYGPDLMIGSLHVAVDDSMSAHEIHGLTRSISTTMMERHGIVMTVGVYAVATGTGSQAKLQSVVMQAVTARKEVIQAHGFYYHEKDEMITIDVVPDITVRDDAALANSIKGNIKELFPGKEVSVVIDHNYSD